MTYGVIWLCAIGSLLSLGVSLFAMRVAVGAARSLPPKPEPQLPQPPRYIGQKVTP